MINTATQADRDGDRYAIRLARHTGLVLGGRTRYLHVQGSLASCVEAQARAQRHNYLFGWWGIVSVLGRNWAALLHNERAAAHLWALASGESSAKVTVAAEGSPRAG